MKKEKNLMHLIKCPLCGQKKTWRTDNPFKPFCSERCKWIDLGEWASEKRKIEGNEALSSDEEEI